MNIPACREQKMVFIGKIENRSYIGPRSVTFSFFGWCVVKHFSPKRYAFGKLALHFPPGKPIVFVLRARINPVATTPIARPRTPTLLEPDRKECLSVPTSQPLRASSCGQINNREGSHHGPPGGLLDEAIFYSKFQI